MPRLIAADAQESWTLAELVEHVETTGLDTRDEDNFAHFGLALKKLANNRFFLADLMIAELKDRCDDQVRDNQYSAQVVMLHVSNSGYLIRANFWPAMQDSVIRHSGTDPFLYHVPHDHNFSFLTVGYLGSGYWSDYYEYDYGEVVGYPGEPVNLKFVEKARLDRGKVMLYRAHRDIHLQLPADDMSVSLNILETSPSATFRDQYRFDVETNRIAAVMTRMSLEPMLALAAQFGGEAGAALLADFAAGHPSDRVRWFALKARAAASAALDDRLAVYAEGARSDSLLVAAMAKREAERIEAGRAWIAAAPPDVVPA
ncbi:transposase [Sphingosinicella sp.]|uniref:transposase n=1 Tax=Sphingosinicella sp. TaxID=1917971 RepID=UPI0040382406